MKVPPKWLMMFSVCIPCIGQFVFLYIISSTYSNLQFIRPETNRYLLRDLLLCLLTCGVYTLAIPYLLLRETEKGAERMQVSLGNYKAMGIIFGAIQLFLYPTAMSINGPLADIFLFLFLTIDQLVLSYLFISPYETIYKEYEMYLD